MRVSLGQAKADFIERSRRFSFLALIALALFASFWFVPRETNQFQTIAIEPDIYIQGGDPSWIPIGSMIFLTFFWPYIGFFYIRGAVSFDEKTGVEHLITTSGARNLNYLFGKFLSGTFFMYTIAVAVMLGSYFMTIWHFPGQFLTAYAFLSPYLLLLTTMPLVAALAVMFGAFRPLRGVWGAVLLLFVSWITVYVGFLENPSPMVRALDITAISSFMDIFARTSYALTGHEISHITIIGGGMDVEVPPTMQLIFNGLMYNFFDFIVMGLMFVYALGFVLLSVPLLGISRKLAKVRLKSDDIVLTTKEQRMPPVYTAVSATKKTMWLSGIKAELNLMLKRQPLVWKLVGLTGIVLCSVLDIELVQVYVMPLLMIWFVGVFSTLGCREHQQDMLKIIATIPSGKIKQIVFSWIAGILIAFTLVIPVIIRMLAVGQYGGVFAALAGAVFVPSLAMFFGEITKTNRFFEVLFIVITYLILNGVVFSMYMGVHPDVYNPVQAVLYLVAGVVTGIVAIIKRKVYP